MNAFTTVAVANHAPFLTDMHKEKPLLKFHGTDPDTELPLLIRYRGRDAAAKAAEIVPAGLVLVIGEVVRQSRRMGYRRPALVVEADELSPIPMSAADSLSMSLAWEVHAHSASKPGLPFLEGDEYEGRRF